MSEARITLVPSVDKGDRSGWRAVRFEQMAENITDRVDDPAEAGVEYYVGLEHLDPESLKVRRWGAPTDVEATKLRFQPGDIIFGRRRAYQRKLAVAEFEGICSAHALVLRARPETVIPEFLPFFIQSETFFERALAISVGSLSPTINWKTLARQEFLIPPEEEQRRIANILWAVDQAWHKARECVIAAITARSAILTRMIECQDYVQATTSPRWPEVRLGDLFTRSPESGHSAVSSGSETGHYVLALSALTREGYVPGELKPVAVSPEVLATKLQRGDLLISRSNTIELVGLAGIFDEDREDVSFPDTMMRLKVDESRILKPFLERVLLSPIGRTQLCRIAAGTSASMKKINRVNLASLVIPLPSVEDQHRIMDVFGSLSTGVAAAQTRRDRLVDLKRALVQSLI